MWKICFNVWFDSFIIFLVYWWRGILFRWHDISLSIQSLLLSTQIEKALWQDPWLFYFNVYPKMYGIYVCLILNSQLHFRCLHTMSLVLSRHSSILLFTFRIYFSQLFFFLHFPPNIDHPSSVKQRVKPPKRDHPPCNLGKQMTNTCCFSETLAASASCYSWWQLVCATKCTTLMAAKAWRDAPLSFPFTLRCLLMPEMLVLMGNRK